MARKRKDGRRTKSGRLSRAGKPREARLGPTEENAAKMRALVNGSDPALAASAVGILFANAHLSEAQYVAAMRYSRAHAIVFGRPWAHIQDALKCMPWGGDPPTDGQHEWAERQLDKWHAKLSLDQRQAIANVTVFGFIPTFFFVSRLRLKMLPEDIAEREALLYGLETLADAMGEQVQQRAA
jgi:hypothetical protein